MGVFREIRASLHHLSRVVLMLVILSPITGGQAAPAGTHDPQDRAPVLERPLALNIPYELWHILQPDSTASAILRIDMTGKVVDWICLEVPHPGLLKALGRAFADAGFLPGLADGDPVVTDILVEIPVGEASRYGILTITAKEYLEGRIAAINPELYQMSLSLPGELDRPLRVVSTGEPIAVADEGGRILTGEVLFDFYIDQEGLPRLIRTAEGPHPALREAAILMVQAFRFEPPRRKGRETVVKARMPVVFG